MNSSSTRRVAIVAALIVAAIAGCSAAASTPAPVSVPTPSPAPSPAIITTPEEAVARLVATEPRFAGIKPYNREGLVGQSRYYMVEQELGSTAYLVSVFIGWGDCPAGCIDSHSWKYRVARDGTVTLTFEGGDPDPPGPQDPQ
jgi:hypothetical protein